jgi:hypothetical protein
MIGIKKLALSALLALTLVGGGLLVGANLAPQAGAAVEHHVELIAGSRGMSIGREST